MGAIVPLSARRALGMARRVKAPGLPMKPSEYFRRNCWVSVEADEDTVTQYVETFGDETRRSSRPTTPGDSKYPHAVDTFDKLRLSDESKARIVSTETGGALRHPARQEGLTAREALFAPSALKPELTPPSSS